MRRVFHRGIAAGILALAALAVAPGANAQLLMDFTGGTAVTPDGNTVGGWSFAVRSSFTFNQLGFWDEGSDGLAHSHDVGLWDISGVLLTSATVTTSATAVTSAEASGQWLFTDVGQMTLGPGTYVLGATYIDKDADKARISTTSAMFQDTAFVEARQKAGASSLSFPTQVLQGVNDGVFGPNLRLHGQTVPEGSTLIMFLIGGVTIAGNALSKRGRG